MDHEDAALRIAAVGRRILQYPLIKLFIACSTGVAALGAGMLNSIGAEYVPLINKGSLLINIGVYASIVAILISILYRIFDWLRIRTAAVKSGKFKVIKIIGIFLPFLAGTLFGILWALDYIAVLLTILEANHKSSTGYWQLGSFVVVVSILSILVIMCIIKDKYTIYIVTLGPILMFFLGTLYIDRLCTKPPTVRVHTTEQNEDFDATIILSDGDGVLLFSSSTQGIAYYNWQRIKYISQLRPLPRMLSPYQAIENFRKRYDGQSGH